jgi:hypothetical protein
LAERTQLLAPAVLAVTLAVTSCGKTAGRRDVTAFIKDMGRIGVDACGKGFLE